MNPEFELISQRIAQAKHPEELFGALEGVPDRVRAGRAIFRNLSKLTHPDLHPDSDEQLVAKEAFTRLSILWEQAQIKLGAGTYGVIEEEKITVKAHRKEYEISGVPFRSGVANLYRCSFPDGAETRNAVFKVVRDPMDNDLLENEARVLGLLKDSSEYDRFARYIPELTDSLVFRDAADPTPRRANVFLRDQYDYFSLQEIREANPRGIDPKDVAWIWRRLLVGTGFAHTNQVVHGALLPPNIFIQPENHGLLLHEWSYAVAEPETSGETIQAINADFERWYPQEVFQKKAPTPSLDIYMGAKNMVYLLGGDPETITFSSSVDRPLQKFFQGCLMEHPWQRPKNSWRLLEEFDGLLADLWGPRRFHPFGVPKISTESPFR